MSILETLKGSNLQNLEFMYGQFVKDNDSFTNTINNSEAKIKVIGEDLLILGEVKKLLIKLKNSKMIDKKDFILNTINTALSDVFLDQNIKIDIVASNTNQEASKLNIKYDVVLFQNNLEMARNEKMLNNNGGGVLSFISILFKILVGYIYSRNKFYIFDESIAEVSELYRPRMAQFFQKFCSVHGFTIVLITQTSDIAEFADLTYYLDGEFEDGIPTLKIDKIDGEDPKTNYIFTEIENFQSIKKLKFKYKGFTAVIGKNNIGKSASFRAVNSLLFNAFDTKEYPRMLSSERPDKRLNTRIVFGFVGEDGEAHDKVIEVYKKGTSLIYKFDGNEFVGKMLAFEKVKDKIESIGFRYLRLKDSYKNFKGSLKDQTERLAITTQQDDYYLIGGKAADTAKVFDFLFDSREVTLAIITLNEDILNFEKEINNLNLDVFVARNAQKANDVKLRLCVNIYKQKLIEYLNSSVSEIHYLEHCADVNLKVINKIDEMTNLILTKDSLVYEAGKVEFLENEVTKINARLQIISILISKEENLILLNNLFMNITQIKILEIEIKKNINYQNGLFLANYFEEKNKVAILENDLNKNLRKVGVLTDLINTLSKIDLLEQFMFAYDTLTSQDLRIKNLTTKSMILGKIITNTILKEENRLIVSNILSQIDFIVQAEKSINYNKKLLQIYNLRDQIDYINGYIFEYNKLSEAITLKQNQYNDLQFKFNNLHTHFGLVPCSSCGGIGFCN